MGQILAAEFADPALADALTSTDDMLIIEMNRHHDDHWGDCVCPTHREFVGHNHLGQALMALRSDLRGDNVDHWPRVGVTGHRDLTGPQATWTRTELGRVLRKLRTNHGSRVLIDGMAMGADLIAVHVAISDAGLRLLAYLPFADQTARWPANAAREQEQLRAQTRRVVVLGEGTASTGPRSRYLRLLHDRNRLIVRDADVLIAIHDRTRTSGGTATTVAHAKQQGLPIITVDPAAATVTLNR